MRRIATFYAALLPIIHTKLFMVVAIFVVTQTMTSSRHLASSPEYQIKISNHAAVT